MSKIGKSLKKQYGRLPRFGRKPKDVTVNKITYTKPERQISLDNAIKQHQKALAKKAEQKKIQRQKVINAVRKGIGRLQ